jgi:NAD(P)-dependent dehydrogenase (short-subunit alcohol dehydrogenase family)
MADIIITGASAGIGRALALALGERPGGPRLLLVARRRQLLDESVARIAGRGGRAVAVPGDLGSLAAARDLSSRLLDLAEEGATLIHNAGIWPAKRVVTAEGLERSFVVNHLAPLVLQRSLLQAGRLSRVLVVSAGLIGKGRFDPDRTPHGDDFSALRTYCTTKLCFAIAMRDMAADHPELDVLILHPGVVRTDLGARPGPLGWLLSLVKRILEKPEDCAARLVRILDRPRWSPPGAARWLELEEERPWPARACDEQTVRGVREATAALLPGEAGSRVDHET